MTSELEPTSSTVSVTLPQSTLYKKRKILTKHQRRSAIIRDCLWMGCFFLAAILVFAGVASASTNLVSNPSLETAAASDLPLDWNKGRWGTNTTVFTYPVTGYLSVSAAKVEMTSYTSGDAKWYPKDIPVTPATEYTFNSAYHSTVKSYVTVRYLQTDGSVKWQDIATLDPSPIWKTLSRAVVPPAGTVSLTVFHLIKGVGELTIDDFDLQEVAALPPQDPNDLIKNSSLEIMGSNGLPSDWSRGRWGTNTTAFTYPVAGYQSARAAKVEITSYTSGDAKWYPNEIDISPGEEYEFTGFYQATTNSYITLRYRLNDGTIKWVDIASLPASSSWDSIKKVFIAPANATAVTVQQLINSVGSLTVDQFELAHLETTPPPPSDPENLIVNPSLEVVGTNNDPQDWRRGGWGSNTRILTYPVAGFASARAAKVEITSYTSGDAKWYPEEVSVSQAKMYEFSDYYKATIGSYITLRFSMSDGSVRWVDIASLGAASSWTRVKRAFAPPTGAVGVTIFHLIKSAGTLTVDAYSLKEVAVSGGMVSLNFDDGWKSIYQNAIPMLNRANLKSTQYIVTSRLNGYASYVSANEVLSMQSSGHEIGAHTRTHRDLTQMSESEARSEILGSVQDLKDIGVNLVDTFAYPFGAFDETTDRIVRESSLISARTTLDGFNDADSDRYLLGRQSVELNVPVSQVKRWIDAARANGTWLILVFHRVDESGTSYSYTPANLQQIVDYLQEEAVPVVTMHDAVQKLYL